VQAVEDAFGAADLTAIEQGFTEDAVARFADFPEMRGREAIMRFLRARFARTQGYRLKKTLHCVMGDTLANTWDASWHDAQTGKPMLGRGTEIWVVRDGLHRGVGCDIQRMGERRAARDAGGVIPGSLATFIDGLGPTIRVCAGGQDRRCSGPAEFLHGQPAFQIPRHVPDPVAVELHDVDIVRGRGLAGRRTGPPSPVCVARRRHRRRRCVVRRRWQTISPRSVRRA
jgi:nuclear transport factor 2 (NTF2) superfamily protein